MHKLGAIAKQKANAKVALKEIDARLRAQQRADRIRLVAEIGAALLADAEQANSGTSGARRAYIRDVLDRNVKNEGKRAFLTSKGWLS